MRVDSLPSLAREYWHAFSHQKPGLGYAEEIPRLTLEVSTLRIDAGALARYRAFVASPEPFPLSFAYVLAQPAHFHLVNLPEFPVRTVGLVHADNRCVRLREIDVARPLALEVAVTGDRMRRRGREFTLRTRYLQDGEVVAEMTSGCFTRVRGAPRGEGAPAPESPPPPTPVGEALLPLRFAAHFGRRYARVSGDWNPIHLAGWLARPFGFRRAIAHGVGAMARIEAELAQRAGTPTRELAISFRRPLELPCQTTLHRRAGDDEGFVLVDSQGRELLNGIRR